MRIVLDVRLFGLPAVPPEATSSGSDSAPVAATGIEFIGTEVEPGEKPSRRRSLKDIEAKLNVSTS